MTVADRIKQRRIELGLSQEELAHKMGYASKSAVSRTENSGDDIGRKRIIAFAKALDCSPSDLMDWKEEVHKINIPSDYDIYVQTLGEEKASLIEVIKTMSPEEIDKLLKLMTIIYPNLKDGD